MASVTQIKRLLELLEHLQSEHAYNARQLAEQSGVSRRTLFRDLRALEKLGFEIRYDERAQRYVVEGDSAQLVGGEEKTDELKTLMTLGKRLEGGPDELRRRIAELPQFLNIRGEGPDSEAATLFSELLTGISERSKLRIMQTDSAGGTHVGSVSPCRMVFSYGGWHLVSLGDDGSPRIDSLASVVRAERTEDSFELPPKEEVDAIVDELIGAGAAGVAEDVVVRFSSDVAKSVAQKKWFERQELEWLDDGQLELRTQADASRMVQWVLSFGGDAAVVKPDVLRRDVATHVSRMAERYDTKV